MTPSASTRVTRPTKRLRAERPTPDGSGGAAADCWAKAARSRPSSTRRPASSLDAANVPASIHRRTESSLTPSSPAASRIRNCRTSATLTPLLRTSGLLRVLLWRHVGGAYYPPGLVSEALEAHRKRV